MKSAPPAEFILRLYVTSATPASSRALVNTRKLCEKYLQGRYQLEIFNIADHVAQAAADQIVASPTLLKCTPLPVRRFIGDMSNTERILSDLGIAG